MRNYTHFKGGLSKIEFDDVTGEFVTKIVPVLPEVDHPDLTEDASRKVEERSIIAEVTYRAIAAE